VAQPENEQLDPSDGMAEKGSEPEEDDHDALEAPGGGE